MMVVGRTSGGKDNELSGRDGMGFRRWHDYSHLVFHEGNTTGRNSTLNEYGCATRNHGSLYCFLAQKEQQCVYLVDSAVSSTAVL